MPWASENSKQEKLYLTFMLEDIKIVIIYEQGEHKIQFYVLCVCYFLKLVYCKVYAYTFLK